MYARAKGIYVFMIEINNLVKNFGKKRALDGVSFSVKKGEIVGFLGPNGAGKSTTMNIITGYITPSSGSVTVGGVDVFSEPMKVKKMVGFLPEQPPLYIDMTVWEYLCFVYELKGCKLNRRAHLTEICDLVKITDVKNRLIKNLSKGYKQRVGIAAAIIGGTSFFGGKGKIFGVVMGGLIIGVINFGMNLLSVSSTLQQVVMGALIIGSVTLDRFVAGNK